jgi:hypothetical protein
MRMPAASRAHWSRPASGVVRRHLHHLQDHVSHFDLESIERTLRDDPAFKAEGHCAVTLAKYPDLRIVLVAMGKGARVGDASAMARLSVQVLRGQVALYHADGTLPLRRGQVATLDHAMALEFEALDDECALLLTLAWEGETDDAALA